ncbi:hypothetical protein PV326_005746 [Microctonus aethiopoides]|uniref:Uncharacterized protein n=1 Tax=Microctonus aethiopoides TaxID=144406 RepID=A0AA39F7E5_9HYME|nr:hypothetical protein PV326_005746 [Microctonus aethiopoides]KAK0164328.1 hypothetical protein PV328_002969 [Microctonus aethiopoides]
MMMMDMGMYGTYGKPDSYYNFQSTNHQLSSGSGGSIAGHATVSQSPELTINSHYYPQTAVAPFTTSSNDIYLTPESASSGPAGSSQTFYSPSGAVLHDDGTAIISSENGLSYTNLDYSNYANNQQQQQQQQNLSCHNNEQHNQTFQIQDVGYRDDNRGGTSSATSTAASAIIHQQSLTIGQVPIHIRTDHEQQLSHHHHHHHHHQLHQHQHLHQSSHHSSSSEYQILPTTSSNYLNHHPSEVDPALHYSASAQTSMTTLRQTAEYTIHPTAHYKEECTDLTGYRSSSLQQSTHSVHTPVHEHHQQHRQAQGHALGVQQTQQQQQHTQVPTYKWMQVKRNVPKPVG